MPEGVSAKLDDPKRFSFRLALLYAALYAGFGLHMPYFPVWLQAKGLDESSIGLVLASGLLVRIIGTPVVTSLADRGGSLSTALTIACCATAALFVGVTWSEGFVMIALACALTGFVWTSLVPLTDAYGLKGVAARGLDYGRIRVWGSVSFLIATLLGGVLLAVFGALNIVWAILISLVWLAISGAMLVPDAQDRPPADQPAPKGFLDRRFILVMMAAAGLQASHALFYSFSAINWKSLGYSGTTVGLLWGVGIVAEIALFWGAGRLTGGWRPTSFLLIGGACGIARWIAFAFEPPFAALFPLMLLHAASFGLVHLGTMAYLADRLPPTARARGQGTMSIAMGVSMAGSTALAGALYAGIGVKAYFAMAGIALIGWCIAAYARSLPRLATN